MRFTPIMKTLIKDLYEASQLYVQPVRLSAACKLIIYQASPG
jgi:hypothetical protein